MTVGRSNFDSVSFYILGDDDVARDACGFTNNKSLISDGVPVANGLYDPHYGTTELGWNCQTCFNNKILCPGHDGVATVNYPLQNPLFRKELLKWLRIVCHECGAMVINKELPSTMPAANRLGEFVKLVRSGNEKYRLCVQCKAVHPWVTKDPLRHGVLWAELHTKGNKGKVERRELYNNEMQVILGRITEANVVRMGKSILSHPQKLLVTNIKICSTVIRPEIRKIGGNRSSMADTTAHLRSMLDLNASIPRDIPKVVDSDLHGRLVMIDLQFFDMIQGSATPTKGLNMMTNTNKIANSLAARFPKKHGRLRANLMGKRTTKMARSVITGDKALRPDQLGVPLMIAQNMYRPETVRSWNIDRLTVYLLNGPNVYPGCNKIKRQSTGYEHYVESMSRDYVLQEGDVVYRHLIDSDSAGFNLIWE